MAREIVVAVLVFIIFNEKAWAVQAPLKSLNDGNTIPTIAFGTYSPGAEAAVMKQAVYWAIEAGYRHIDTAELYNNEQQVGQAIAEALQKGLVTREELFITTKIWNNHHARDQVIPALRESLKRLGLDYVNLYLIHSPVAQAVNGSFLDVDYLDTWRGMEDAKKQGLAKSIGVSNFNSEQIARVLKNCEIKPAVNEIEVNPTLTQETLVTYCRSVGIEVMSYSPFGFLVSRNRDPTPTPKLDDPELTKIAQKHGKNTSQVVLRYLIDRGTIPIPKSFTKERIFKNIDIFDFSLTDEEIAVVNKFNRNVRVVDITAWKDHPYYPFDKP